MSVCVVVVVVVVVVGGGVRAPTSLFYCCLHCLHDFPPTRAHTPTARAQVSISDFLTLFSARTHDGYFWSSAPSQILLWAALTALSISTILACVWPEGNTDHIRTEGLARKTDYGDYTLMPLWTWIYCIFW